MIVGYLLLCLASNDCYLFSDTFESIEKCEAAGKEAVELLPKKYPQVVGVSVRCEAAGTPA